MHLVHREKFLSKFPSLSSLAHSLSLILRLKISLWFILKINVFFFGPRRIASFFFYIHQPTTTGLNSLKILSLFEDRMRHSVLLLLFFFFFFFEHSKHFKFHLYLWKSKKLSPLSKITVHKSPSLYILIFFYIIKQSDIELKRDTQIQTNDNDDDESKMQLIFKHLGILRKINYLKLK